MAGKYKISAEQGATLRRTFTVRNADQSLRDFTGYTARMQVRTAVDANVIVLNLTTENGGITMGGTAGTVSIYVSDTDMDALAGSYVYDLEIQAPVSGDVTRLLEGGFTVKAQVTR